MTWREVANKTSYYPALQGTLCSYVRLSGANIYSRLWFTVFFAPLTSFDMFPSTTEYLDSNRKLRTFESDFTMSTANLTVVNYLFTIIFLANMFLLHEPHVQTFNIRKDEPFERHT
ncbi:CLUMA_CG007989, isoform A [Clunio marinus]|uniref:CLUMA_CG007989, isoform A n=1 Tax=Clunio marinus TaxID=568069 RepID=A0A1J1I2Q8_9DIPT|nr:CLUMA_CG007989, isoform A [Clunio marinus]